MAIDLPILKVVRLVLLLTIGLCIAIAAIGVRLFSVVRFESIIHEFDPWFNFRATKHLVENGFYSFLNWFDDKTWYPLGRVTGGTLYPGLMVTAATLYNLIHQLGFPVNIRDVCVMLAPAFSILTAWATYSFTKEIADSLPSLKSKTPTALFSAAFIAIVPGYISRSVAGSYDNEAIAITLLMATFYFWVKSVRLGSILYASITAMFYFYMVSAWGGYVFITNMIPLHIFILVLMGRFTEKLYTAYCTWYSLGTLMSMQIPFVGFMPIRSNDHMAAFGVFGLLQLVLVANYFRDTLTKAQFKHFMIISVAVIFTLGVSFLILATKLGLIAPWTGRFYSLWDTNYAKIHIPIIASVSEHQPTPWSSFYFDLNFLIWLFPVGVYICFQDLSNEAVFIIIYSVLGSYFAGVMVRLMLTLAPVVCVAGALTIGKIFEIYLDFSSVKDRKGTSNYQFAIISRLVVIGTFFFYLMFYIQHCVWVDSNVYSSPSVVLSTTGKNGKSTLIDDYREAYYWLRMNTAEDAKVMAWWDYGYQIGGMADRTTFVDNNTWNNTHIATVGKAFAVSEEKSEVIMRHLGVDYVLVIFGGLLGFNGDDLNKFLWMIRISEGIWPEDVSERSFFTDRGEYRIDDQATDALKNSLMYKLSYYRFGELFNGKPATDRVRHQSLSAHYAEGIVLNSMEEVFTSENWMVRIYKLKPEDPLGRPLTTVGEFERSDLTKRQKRNLLKKRPSAGELLL